MVHRLGRMPGSAHRVAWGLACGVAVGLTPFVGVHFLMAASLALVTGGSVIAALLGTFVLNPWTAPFIWWGSFQLGQWLLRLFLGRPGVDGGEFLEFFGALGKAALTFDGGLFAREVWPVLFPMMVGSTLMAAVACIVVYWGSWRLVRSYQRQRFNQRLQRTAGQRPMESGSDGSGYLDSPDAAERSAVTPRTAAVGPESPSS